MITGSHVTPCHTECHTMDSDDEQPPSLFARAMGARVMRAPDDAERQLPSRWEPVHVMDRLEDAWSTLARMPVAVGPRGHANAMPRHVYDRGDLNAQMETFELERTMALANRVRIPPTPTEISQMHQAFGWISTYLGSDARLARAVNLGARWASAGQKTGPACRRLGIEPETFQNRQWNGVLAIVAGLIRDRVPVT